MTATTTLLPAAEGHAIVHRSTVDGRKGRCLVVPPFGVPAELLRVLTNELDDIGFETLRLDPRDHVGDGTGSIEQFRMSTFADDCARAIDAHRPSCVVALSLGARAVMRALTMAEHTPHAVLGIPVVDVQFTVSTILGHDWFDSPLPDIPPNIEVLGHTVRARDFVADCREHGFTDTIGTYRDLVAAGAPIRLLPGDADPWVERDAVVTLAERAVAAGGGTIDVRTVRCDRHDIHNDVEQALALVGELIDEVVAGGGPEGGRS